MTAEEKSSATQKLIDKLGEMGVTSEQATQAFETLRQKGLITDDEQCGKHNGNAEKDPNKLNRRSGSR